MRHHQAQTFHVIASRSFGSNTAPTPIQANSQSQRQTSTNEHNQHSRLLRLLVLVLPLRLNNNDKYNHCVPTALNRAQAGRNVVGMSSAWSGLTQ